MGKSIKQCHQKCKEEKKAFNKVLLGVCTWELGLDEFEQEGGCWRRSPLKVADEKAAWPALLGGALAETHQSVGVGLARPPACDSPASRGSAEQPSSGRWLRFNRGSGETEGSKLQGNRPPPGMTRL